MSQNSTKKDKKLLRKPSASLSDISDFSSDSDETTFEDFEEIKKQRALYNDKHEDFWKNSYETSTENHEQDEDQDLRTSHKQQEQLRAKKKFTSISRVFNEKVKEQMSFKSNLQLKRQEQNNKIRQWKVNLYKKVYLTHSKRRSITQMKNFQKGLEKMKLTQENQTKQFSLHICSCSKKFACHSSLRTHIRYIKVSHYPILSINSFDNRKRLTKFYNVVGHSLQIESFDQKLLYENFIVIFLDAEIHSCQFNNSANQQFKSSLIGLKDYEIVFSDSYNQEIQKWFKTQWFNIYKSLHEIHKGNQFICHKSLSVQEHICLFALALDKFVNRCKRNQFSKMDAINFKSISQLIQVVLKDCIEKPKQKMVKIQSTDSKKVLKFLECIRDMLFRYFETFEYIDLDQFEVKKDLNDDFY